ncbi:MAG: hypothetical protein WD887_02015 [Candidatus Saccharimonadales bacterium]
MRIVILYHPKSEHEGKVLDYVRDYHIRHPDRKVELISLETMKGSDMARLYDITRYPAILVITNEGGLQQLWQGETLPLMNEVDAFVHA